MDNFAKIYRIDNYRIPYASLIADDNLSIERDRENIRSIVFQIVESVCVGKYYSNSDIIKELGGSNYFGVILTVPSTKIKGYYAWLLIKKKMNILNMVKMESFVRL